MDVPERCPCGTGERYERCCGPLLLGDRPAVTAEALMRSRYTAFVVGDDDYLAVSWHPSTRPHRVTAGDPTRWLGLTVVATEAGGMLDTDGVVEFVARHRDGELRERSRFTRVDGEWRYLDGT